MRIQYDVKILTPTIHDSPTIIKIRDVKLQLVGIASCVLEKTIDTV